MDPVVPAARRNIESIRRDAAAYQQLRDDLDLRSFACDQLHEDLKFVLADAKRLDWLERLALEPQGLHLHDGKHSGCRGLGLRPRDPPRSLREAIDAAMNAEARL